MNDTDNPGMTIDPLDRVENYYTGKLREHGATPRGVDWNSVESQVLRFDQLLKVCDLSEPFSIIDYGCGFGSLVEHLRQRAAGFTYIGYDISEAMIGEARTLFGDDPSCRFVGSLEQAGTADFAVASGVMNVRLEFGIEAWEAHVYRTMDELNRISTKGFAFNVLTKYSDADRMRDDLYYGDPLALFDHCKRNYSRQVALLHDYPLYEFTILVRK
jgi:SAM-dependent methyltransferase